VLRALLPDGVRLTVILGLLAAPGFVVAQDSACTQAQRDEYLGKLQRRISENWRLPSNYRNVDCTVLVVQSFRGEVLNAAVQDCTDPELNRTIEDATYLSSPLPLPANDSCFERRIEIRVVRPLD